MMEIIRAILSANRVVVIDTLSFCNAFSRHLSIPDSIDMLRNKYGQSLFIFVIKKQYTSPNFGDITNEYKDTMIVECNDDVFIMKNRNVKAVGRTDWESEADDHMTQIIERTVAITGCAAFHEGVDKYRNAKDIANYMPSYPYHTYMRGNKTDDVMVSTSNWTKIAVASIILNGPRQQCVPGKVGFCRSKGHIKHPCCKICGICIECQFKISNKRNLIISQLLESEEPQILRKLSRYNDLNCIIPEQIPYSAI